MASRYWTPSGNGNVSSTTNWSATSGGASGASKPGSGDDVIVDSASGTGVITVDETTTWLSLSISGRAVYDTIELAANLTVSTDLNLTGNNASTQRLLVKSSVPGTARTITAAAGGFTNVDFEDIIGAGSLSPFAGSLIGNCGGNTNITQTTPITYYWVHAGADSRVITDALWFTASGGAVAARFPLPQDTAVFDGSSFGAASKVITIGTAGLRLPNINWTGATNTPTLSLDATCNIYGSLTLIAAMTFSGASLPTFKGRSTFTLTSATRTFPGSLTLDAFGGQITQQDASIVTGALTVTRGTFQANNMAVTAASFASNNTNTRALNMGSGTWTITGSGGCWNTNTTTGLTLNASTSTINLTNAASSGKTVFLGNTTIFNLTFSGIGVGTYLVDGVGATISGTTTVSNSGAAVVDLFSTASITHTNITFAGATVTWAGSTAGSIAGNLTLAAGVTLTYSGTLTFTATSSKTITSASKTFTGVLLFAGVAGTWTLQDALITTSVIQLNNGTLATGSFNLTCLRYQCGTTNTRAITGSGTIETTGTGAVWTATATGLTMTGFTGTIKISDASSSVKTFSGGGKTYKLLLNSASSGSFDFVGDNTYARMDKY